MATQKSPRKKTAKNTNAKTAPAAKTTKKVVKGKASTKNKDVKSFVLTAEREPFFTFKVTKQTLYWLVIAVISLAFSGWIYKVQADINDLYDQIELMQASESTLSQPLETPKVNTEPQSDQPEAN